MKLEVTAEELAIYEEISRIGESLWEVSLGISGLNSDPKMFSIMLFKRLWSNHRGFTLLWNNGLQLEADIVLRSGVEAAICIAANHRMGDMFVTMMRGDAAFTVQGQIKRLRASGEEQRAREGEEALAGLMKGLPDGCKPAKLNWRELAESGGYPQMYEQHRMLSGVSSHVTGLSVLNGVVSGEKSEELQDEWRDLTRKMHLMMMAGATLHGALVHAQMIGDDALLAVASALVDRMNALSWKWPGVS